MLSDYLIAPSFNSLFVTGLLLFLILITIISNFNDVKKFTTFQKLSILSVLAISVGSHGLIHLGVEKQYGFNPYRWF
jgi:hypothetical protein